PENKRNAMNASINDVANAPNHSLLFKYERGAVASSVGPSLSSRAKMRANENSSPRNTSDADNSSAKNPTTPRLLRFLMMARRSFSKLGSRYGIIFLTSVTT